MVVRNTYQPIDPIGPDFPTDGPPIGRTGPPAPPRGVSRTPNASPFMLSQNGLAKADLLVMHNSWLTPVAAIPAGVCRNRLNALCIKGSSGSYGGIEIAPDRSGRTEP